MIFTYTVSRTTCDTILVIEPDDTYSFLSIGSESVIESRITEIFKSTQTFKEFKPLPYIILKH